MPFLSIIERSNSFCLFNDYFNRATNIATKFFPMLLRLGKMERLLIETIFCKIPHFIWR